MRTDRLTCDCGGEIEQPIPQHCPHCGSKLVGVHRRMWSRIVPLVAVVLMFAGLFVALLALALK